MDQVQGVSQKSLTKTLRQAEHEGLVKRSIFAEVPPRVEYELTDLGQEMLSQIYPLVRWTVSNINVSLQPRILRNERYFSAGERGRGKCVFNPGVTCRQTRVGIKIES